MNHRSSGRPGFTLVEVLFSTVLTFIVFGSTMYFMQMGNKSVAKVSDHAQARINAIKILNQVFEDLERCVVDDNISNLVFPVKISDGGNTLEFYALHHRQYSRSTQEMKLVAARIRYELRAVPGRKGAYHVLRNGLKLARGKTGFYDPVSNLIFKELDHARACELSISPFHAIWVKVYPLAMQEVTNQNLGSEANVQERLVHLSHIESQFACMLSVKAANPPAGAYANLDKLLDPWAGGCPLTSSAPNIPMDWVRPPRLVLYSTVPFDDATSDQDEEVP